MYNESLARIICDSFMIVYKHKYGAQKANAVVNKVRTSTKISGLINKSKFSRICPTARDFQNHIIISPFFMFSKMIRKRLDVLLQYQNGMRR